VIPPILLDGVPADEAERVLRTARRRTFAKGEVIFHEGDPADALYVIVKGRCAVRICTPYGDVATLTVLRDGEIFGEIALLDTRSVRSATVVALEPCEMYLIHRTDFDRLRREYPSVMQVLLNVLTHTIRRLTERLVEALYVPAELRIIHRLLDLANIYSPGAERCVVPLTQEYLSELAGTSRATVNRVLRQEEGRGTLRVGRGSTTILDRRGLERRCQYR
jgi:CRP-like cAMP-binding protein